jgi:multisubunit Na+/H+ antiporter MnhB subunit
MVRSATPGTNHSLGDLVAQAARDISQLVRYEIDLAKSELKVDVKRIVVAAAFAAFAALAGCLIVILLCFAFAYMLHYLGAPGGMAGAFAFTAAAVFILALIGLGIAWLRLKGLTKMRRTRKTVTDDIAMLRGNGNGSSPGVGGATARGVGTGGAAHGVGAGGAGELASADGKPAPLPGSSAG